MADFNDLDSLDDLEPLEDLGDLDDFGDPPSIDDTQPVATASHAASAGGASGLAAVIQDLLARENYQQVVQIAESQKDAVAHDPQVQAMVDQARQRLEERMYAKSFLDAARKAHAAGEYDQAREFVAKARALAPDHPELQALSGGSGAAEATSSPAAPTAPVPPTAPVAPEPEFSVDDEPLTFDSGPEDLQFDLDEPPPLVSGPAEPVAATPAPDDDLAALDPFPELGADLEELEADPFGSDPLEAEPLVPPSPEPSPLEPSPQTQSFDMPADDQALPSIDGIVDLDAEDEPEQGAKIQTLLAEGRALFEADEYQGAIDVWSRIFLIDIDHAEASRLIEEARAKKAERERQAEEFVHQAQDQIEAGDLEAAKASLARALELQPGHSTARDYLDQLEAGEVPVISRSESVDTTADGDPIDLLDDGGLGAIDSVTGADEGHSLEAAVARDRMVVVKRTDKKLVAIGVAVALVVLGVAGFLITQWDSLFPNTETAVATPPPRIDPIVRARAMYEQGKVENAIQLLETIQLSDESYPEAQALIAQWKAEIGTPDSGEGGPSEEMMARRELLLDAARQAQTDEQYLRARRYFDRANRILPLETEDLASRRAADRALAVIGPEIQLFEEGKYEEVIPELWRKREIHPELGDIERMLVDAYYNLALTDLQRQKIAQAAEKLSEALEVQPDNEELQRLKLFAETYAERPQDLLFRIYVKYLPTRT